MSKCVGSRREPAGGASRSCGTTFLGCSNELTAFKWGPFNVSQARSSEVLDCGSRALATCCDCKSRFNMKILARLFGLCRSWRRHQDTGSISPGQSRPATLPHELDKFPTAKANQVLGRAHTSMPRHRNSKWLDATPLRSLYQR